MADTTGVNRLSLILGWAVLTFLAIGVSSAAVGSVGARVSPQPASVLEAAGDVVAFPASTSSTVASSSTVIDPADVKDAKVSTTVAATTASTSPPASTTSRPPTTTGGPATTSTTVTTTAGPGSTTTTTIDGVTTTTVVDGSTTTTTTPPDEIRRRTIESRGGWIRISWTQDRLRLGAAGPRTGFKLEVVENDGEKIVVRFVSFRHISRIEVVLDDGEAKIEVSERTRDS